MISFNHTAARFSLLGVGCACFAVCSTFALETLKYGAPAAVTTRPIVQAQPAPGFEDQDLLATLLLSDPFSPTTLTAEENAEIGALWIGPVGGPRGLDI